MEEYRNKRIEAVRDGLHEMFIPIFNTLLELLDGHWVPTNGLRSIEKQNELYAQGRTKPGKIVTNAKGGMSPHNYGLAVDFAWFNSESDYEYPSSRDKRTLEFGACVEKSGGRWGGNFQGFVDNPHVELWIDVPWSRVYKILKEDGLAEAYKYIEEHRV